jgi:hypothetical protein
MLSIFYYCGEQFHPTGYLSRWLGSFGIVLPQKHSCCSPHNLESLLCSSDHHRQLLFHGVWPFSFICEGFGYQDPSRPLWQLGASIHSDYLLPPPPRPPCMPWLPPFRPSLGIIVSDISGFDVISKLSSSSIISCSSPTPQELRYGGGIWGPDGQPHVWLVLCLPGTNVVIDKWIFCHKLKADDTLDRYKTWWVLQGFTQCHIVDYDETFSPVVKSATIQTVHSLALFWDWAVQQLDVKNVVLHDTLTKTVYYSQSFGFVDSTHLGMVCKLNHSLYGLK